MGFSKEIKHYQRKWVKDLKYKTISTLFIYLLIYLFQPSHEKRDIITMRFGDPTTDPAQSSSEAWSLDFYLKLSLVSFIILTNSEGAGETAWMCRFLRAFPLRLNNNNPLLMSRAWTW